MILAARRYGRDPSELYLGSDLISTIDGGWNRNRRLLTSPDRPLNPWHSFKICLIGCTLEFYSKVLMFISMFLRMVSKCEKKLQMVSNTSISGE